MSDSIRALFFGTPEFAVPSLRALLEVVDVELVVTQPDRPSGRGMRLTPPPVKAIALEHGIDVVQPTKVRTDAFAAELRERRADVALVVAYGRILPRAVLDAPRLGCINVHASLLPRWRGAAPVQWAIMSGDEESGISLMQLDEGMDTGPVLARERTRIDPNETAADLLARLAEAGAAIVRRELPRFVAGDLVATPQDPDGATHARPLVKDDGRLDFAARARAVHDRARGTTPWPGAHTTLAGKRVKVLATRVASESGRFGEPGTIVRSGTDGAEVACGEGAIALLSLQAEGKRAMDASAFLAGQKLTPGAGFGDEDLHEDR